MIDKYIFIGGGHLTYALISGLISSGCDCNRIIVIEPNKGKRESLVKDFNIVCEKSFAGTITSNHVLVLAVRPSDVKTALEQMSHWRYSETRPLLISCAAGVSCEQIKASSQNIDFKIIRAMPNLPVIVQAGVTALYCDIGVSLNYKQRAERLIRAVGTINWLDNEVLMHTVTAVSGSGPGYLFRIMQALVDAAQAHGLSENDARFFVINMVFGSAKMALESNIDLHDLCDQVCVPGGTTAEGVGVLDKNEINSIFLQMIQAAKLKSENIGDVV